MSDDKIVADAIFGFITLKPYIVDIIDTPEFQRLRSICQLGLVPFVYPTANHCRFEHSIGTYWLASKLVTKLQKQLEEQFKKERVISDEDVKCVEIAALCHDLGHGPFSHTWDNKVIQKFCEGSKFKHDKHFEKVWEIVGKNEKVKKMLRENEIDEQLIIKLINGETVKGKEILCSIISNSESGMDVDKWDYLARDASYLGHATTNYRVDIERMIHLARAIKDGDKWTIAFRESESLNMLRVFQLRHYMHKTAYQHKKVIAIELMFVDGIKECIKKEILDKDKIGTPEWILQNTDAIFWSNIEEIPSFKKILHRELYKQRCEATKYGMDDKETVETIKDIEQFINDSIQDYTSLRIGFCAFNNGVKVGNPMTKIPFYNNKQKDTIWRYNTVQCSAQNIPPYLILNCAELRVIVFSIDDGEYSDQVEEIKKHLKNKMFQLLSAL